LPADTDPQKVLRASMEHLTDAVRHAAKWLKSSSTTFIEKDKKRKILGTNWVAEAH
jgi:hypothetical protein